eukprot:scaffold111475_cov27-Tisochrysis_lutea.AAC.2
MALCASMQEARPRAGLPERDALVASCERGVRLVSPARHYPHMRAVHIGADAHVRIEAKAEKK